MYDWWPSFRYATSNLDYTPYEDVLAPDAFGVQLLGPGYRDRVPRGPDWEHRDLGDGCVLLVHRDLAAWFAEPMPAISPQDAMLQAPDFPIPEVVRRAVEEFADPIRAISPQDAMVRHRDFAIPDVVRRAREVFAGILVTPAVVRSSRLDPFAEP